MSTQLYCRPTRARPSVQRQVKPGVEPPAELDTDLGHPQREVLHGEKTLAEVEDVVGVENVLVLVVLHSVFRFGFILSLFFALQTLGGFLPPC